ncbi:MAG: phage head closure protein [Clostridia bacterium]|jgi:SPP1 family predicted phage head-tail adaptor|nr:phage head closure protein [Clostridia bacterium]MBT7123418.1 phage head closure protein [Clostridia bacterium]
MKIGTLRNRVVMQRKEVTEDDLKQQSETWIDFAYIWAAIQPLTGREYFSARQENAEVTTRITIRHLKNVGPEMRVIFGSRVFEILSVINPNELNISLVLMCREVVT